MTGTGTETGETVTGTELTLAGSAERGDQVNSLLKVCISIIPSGISRGNAAGLGDSSGGGSDAAWD